MMAAIFWSLMCSDKWTEHFREMVSFYPCSCFMKWCSYYHNTPQLTKIGHGDISTTVCPKHITKKWQGPGVGAQRLKVLTARPSDPSLIPGTYKTEVEKRLLQVTL